MKHRIILITVTVIATLLILLFIEYLYIKYNGSTVPAPTIPRQPQTLGTGPKLTYVVMGDSTAIGQGTEYKNSYAVASANQLAQDYQVQFVNVGVSGAKTQDVLDTQLKKAATYKPDLVLLAVGANDANNFTSGKTIQSGLQQTIDGLKKSNPKVRIVVTGSPAIDAVPRYIWPYKQFRGLRTKQVNDTFASIIDKNNLTFAPIAAKTRSAFLANPTLFAADKFHPNARGYALWTPVINQALHEALSKSLL